MSETDPEAFSRLAALSDYEILDSSPEKAFDDLAIIAAYICQTPIALVSLVDRDRQWFKAKVGIDACETPIGQAVCALAIRQSDIFVINDLTKDFRTCDNPLVTGEMGLRFYAGVPLITAQGIPVGTLCVIDKVPREDGLTDQQAQMLQRLAAQVLAQMELRRLLFQHADRAAKELDNAAALIRATSDENASLKGIENRTRTAEAAGRIGTFEIVIATNEIIASEEFCRIFGLNPDRDYSASDVEALMVRERGWTAASNKQSRADGSAPLEVAYRIRRANDGQLRWIERRADFKFADDGTVLSMIGTVQDVSDLKRMQLQQDALLTLADRLRDAVDFTAAEISAADILGRTLAASRAGYARLSRDQVRYEVLGEWTDDASSSLIGSHPAKSFASILEKLNTGQTVAISNISAAGWLGVTRSAFTAMGVGAQICVPILEKSELIGVIFVHQSQPRTWNDDEVHFVQGVTDQLEAAMGRLRSEAKQRVLNLELSHRLKNTLTMVQAIAAQTLRNVDPAALDSFSQRISALNSAHEILLKDGWSAVPVKSVATAVLRTHGELSRFDLKGNDFTLGSHVVLSFSLILHELATNALKYGALSNTEGQIFLEWCIEDDGSEPICSFLWRETGGPRVQFPSQKGFGSKLLRMGLLGTGGVETDYQPGGIQVTLKAPLKLIADH